MSIRSQIERINTNIQAAFSAIGDKGVVVPSGATSDNLADLIDVIGIGYIPSYWKSYLASKATEINSALATAGENKSAFLWYTDAHWTTNYGQSPMILKYLSKHTDMKKTFFGGDVAVASSGEIGTLTAWQELVKDIPNHHSVIGNHDNQVSELSTAADRAEFFLMADRTGDMVFGTDATNGKMYYYIDNHIENTRYICLSTGRTWTFSDEIAWCIDVLNSTPAGWHIVIISHLWLNNDYTDNGATLNPTPPDYAQSYLDLFDAYNYRLSGSTSFGSVPYVFANAGAKIEFIIGGHVHRDYDFATATGIPIILTECDCWEERGASTATKGTITENCVYAIVADYGAKAVKIINVGRGNTRTLEIPDVVTYTNVLKTAIDTDGSLYNGGKGYKENCMTDSEGVETQIAGIDTTGYIAAKAGDVIRFKNVTYKIATNINVVRYRSTFVVHSFTSFYSESAIASWSPIYDGNGNIVQITIPSSLSASCVYFRFNMQDINEKSVITVNEEI